MNKVKIVEYTPALAGAVADMWNKSSSGWNGATMARTPEMVISEHSSASHLNVFLAVTGDEVIGYCSLDKYTHDEGALYINLLNVRPDYHGKKVGKMLVLACVEKTLELGWPRLDLNTWPGNTKAVPLYKKCGFFWEKRDNTTHLMNFVPTILRTKAIMDFFQETNWYADSKRLIELTPDGKKENGFDYFEYIWEKSGSFLRVEFERTGRGIRLIETDDYFISTTLENHELVFGRDYAVNYSIVNKSGKPLTVELNGLNDKNITFAMKHLAEVTDKTEVKGVFHINPVTEEQKPWRTHPAVTTEITINGCKALFKTGVLPAYPATINLQLPSQECFLNKKAVCHLNIENKLDEVAVLNFTMKDIDGIQFLEPIVHHELKPKERVSLELPYILNKFTYYTEKINALAQMKDGTVIPFTKQLNVAFRGRSGILSCVSEEFCEVLNGPFTVRLNKQDNCMSFSRLSSDPYNHYWVTPKTGRPFSSELSSRKPDEVVCLTKDNIAIMKASYKLNDFPGLKLTVVTCLEASGIAKHHYEMENISDCETADEIWVCDTFRLDLKNGVLPYDNNFISTGNETEWTQTSWDSSKITENWIFSEKDYVTRGICWAPEQQIQFESWCMFFEHNLGKIKPRQTVSTPPVTLATGVFDRWQDFRAYALGKNISNLLGAERHTELSINGGNPFSDKNYEFNIKEYRNIPHTPVLTVLEKSAGNPGVIAVQVDNGCFLKQIKKAVFYKSKQAVKTGFEIVDEKKVLWADNGLISFRVSADFAYTLYSLKYKNNEWLDSSFPTPGMKSWWNPWFGGITPNLIGLSEVSMLDEERNADFATLIDNKGNVWQGLKMTVKIEKHEKYKGFAFSLYYLTLPGVPVLCVTTEIIQNTGMYLNRQTIENEYFIQADPEISNNRLSVITSAGERLCMTAGKEQNFTDKSDCIHFESPNRKEKLLMYVDSNNIRLDAGANCSIMGAFSVYSAEMKNNKQYFIPPTFMIFTEEYLQSSWLKDLGNIYFGGEEQ